MAREVQLQQQSEEVILQIPKISKSLPDLDVTHQTEPSQTTQRRNVPQQETVDVKSPSELFNKPLLYNLSLQNNNLPKLNSKSLLSPNVTLKMTSKAEHSHQISEAEEDQVYDGQATTTESADMAPVTTTDFTSQIGGKKAVELNDDV